MNSTIETSAFPPTDATALGNEQTVIYIRLHVVPEKLMAAIGFPSLNRIGLMLLADALAAKLLAADVETCDIHFAGFLNTSNIHFTARQFGRAIQITRALLEKHKLWNYATIFYFDPAENHCFPVQYSSGVDRKTQFDRQQFLNESMLWVKTTTAIADMLDKAASELEATLPPPPLPPPAQPPPSGENPA